jgi:hypothetical protein
LSKGNKKCVLNFENALTYGIKKYSTTKTNAQQQAATLTRLKPFQAAIMPRTKAKPPEMGVWVSLTMAGKVITARVT